MSEEQPTKPAVERLVADNVQQTIWLRLRRMTSSRLCRQIISTRAGVLSPEALESKAEGLAWSVRSALGYWQNNPSDLNAKILTRYYALLQISIAEQVASPNESFNLDEVQHHTEQGHGLATLTRPGALFPANYYVASTKSGHFYSYCKYRGIDLGAYAFDKRPRKWDKLQLAEQNRLVSLADLFRRVPELVGMVEECLHIQPLSFHVGYAMRNHVLRSQQMRETVLSSQAAQIRSVVNPTQTTHVAIFPYGKGLTAEYLNSLKLLVQDIIEEHDSATNSDYFVGTLTHPANQFWYDSLETYKSGYCGTSIIVPLWGISDLFVIHFIILYTLSIVVRYLPSLWHQIENGDLDHVRALIEHYMVIVDNVLPRISVERITGVRLIVNHPGSMSAPV